MSTHSACLNCGTPLQQNFCGTCGQTATTHRFSLKHIMAHDLVHGALHLDKGFFFTVKELVIRPGNSIREYVNGKRVNHFNYISFILLIIAANILLTTSTGFHYSDLTGQKKVLNSYEALMSFQRDHYKSLMVIMIVISACVSYTIFRKARLNIAEHMVLNAYRSGAELLLQTTFLAIALLFKKLGIAPVILSLSGIFVLLYNIWFYRQYFRPYYQKASSATFRSIAAHLLASLIVSLAALAILYYTGYLQALIKEASASGGQ